MSKSRVEEGLGRVVGGLDTGRSETSGPTCVPGERAVPPGGLPSCWMWWQGCHLTHRHVGVCGVNGKHRPPLTDARWPHPSQDSPPTP